VKKLILFSCALFITGTIWAQRRNAAPPQPSSVRRAFETREPDAWALRPAWLDEGDPTALRKRREAATLREQHWRAWLTQIPRLVETKNIVSLKLAKAEKTNQWVVTLVDVDGHQTTLWCGNDSGDGNLPVREITPH